MKNPYANKICPFCNNELIKYGNIKFCSKYNEDSINSEIRHRYMRWINADPLDTIEECLDFKQRKITQMYNKYTFECQVSSILKLDPKTYLYENIASLNTAIKLNKNVLKTIKTILMLS